METGTKSDELLFMEFGDRMVPMKRNPLTITKNSNKPKEKIALETKLSELRKQGKIETNKIHRQHSIIVCFVVVKTLHLILLFSYL